MPLRLDLFAAIAFSLIMIIVLSTGTPPVPVEAAPPGGANLDRKIVPPAEREKQVDEPQKRAEKYYLLVAMAKEEKALCTDAAAAQKQTPSEWARWILTETALKQQNKRAEK